MLTKNNWFVFALLGILLLMNNWSLPLWDQDEAAYAGFAKTMNETGDYLIPKYYFSDPHRKTPLHFWDIALSYKIFGVNEFAVRFPSFLAIFGTFLLLFYRGRKLLEEQKVRHGLLILGASILVTSLAKVSVTDATLLFFTTLSAFGIVQTIQNPTKMWIFLFWLGFAMGVLTKGPPIILFIGAFSLLLFIFHPTRKNLFKLRPWFFLPVALIPIFLWGYAINLRGDKEFLNWLIDWYILKRIGGSVYGQEGVFGTHLVFIFGCFIFSSLFFFKAFKDSFFGFIKKDKELIILGSWFIAGWFFYELSPSKLPTYAIAAHIPLALLMGNYSSELSRNQLRPNRIVVIIHYFLQFCFGLGLIIAWKFLKMNDNLIIALIIIGVLFLMNLGIQIIRYKRPSFFNHLFFSNILLLIALWTIAPLFAQHINSSKKVSKYVLENTNSSSTIFIGYAPGSQPSLPFYLSEKNNEIRIQENMDSLLIQLNTSKNFGLIISKQQSEILKLNHPEWKFECISSRLIDRKEMAEYYAVIVK